MNSKLQSFLSTLRQEIPVDIEQQLTAQEWKDQEFSERFFAQTRTGYLPAQAEIDFLLNLVGDGPFLDLGCGNGRLTKPLLTRAQGIGVDINHSTLQGLDFPRIQAGLVSPPVSGQYSLIILGFGQVCFLRKSEFQTLMKSLKRLLLPEGRIYLDLPTIELMQELDGANEFSIEGDNTVFAIRQFVPSESLFLQRLLTLSSQGETLADLTFAYQLYSLYELLDCFMELRLRVEYGAEDLQQSPIKETSAWMVFLLQKI